jgi:hypothetical protein
MKVARLGGTRNELLHRKGTVKNNTKVFYRVTDRNGSVVKLKGKRGGELCDFLSCTYEHGFCLVVVKL